MKKTAPKLARKNTTATKTDLKETENRFSNKLKETEERLNKKIDNGLKQTEERLNKRIDRVLKYVRFEIEPLKAFYKEMREFKDKVLDRLDWLIGKYEKFEQEYTIQNEHNSRMLDRIENHEKRIITLEKTSTIN